MEGDGIVGRSELIMTAQQMMNKIAPSDATVLITGESGTGKELVARAIHARSFRSDREFIPVDCGALCAQIMESELFGHVRGAFTGALAEKPGLVESARGGTLFLDEIGNLDASPQQKILRFLECGEYRPLGGVTLRRSDARIISATNRDLRQDVRDGRFREDLFYRLNHFHISLPPLRERKGDILLLIDHFLDKVAKKIGLPHPEIGPTTMEALMSYTWPGNIRELAHTIEHMALMAEGPCLGYQDLPEDVRNEVPCDGDRDQVTRHYREARKQTLDAFNAAYVSGALRRNLGNVTFAARESGLRRQSFQGLMKRYSILSKDFRPNLF